MTNIEIYNARGEVIYQERNISHDLIEIETGNFEDGTYFYKVINKETNQIEEGKLVVNNN